MAFQTSTIACGTSFHRSAAAQTKLTAEDATSAEVARLRLFAGLTVDEAAEAVGVSRATAFREWAYARAWLAAALTHGGPIGP